MDANIKKELQKIACTVKMCLIKCIYNAKSEHLGGLL